MNGIILYVTFETVFITQDNPLRFIHVVVSIVLCFLLLSSVPRDGFTIVCLITQLKDMYPTPIFGGTY
jgi:hypothetical protein